MIVTATLVILGVLICIASVWAVKQDTELRKLRKENKESEENAYEALKECTELKKEIKRLGIVNKQQKEELTALKGRKIFAAIKNDPLSLRLPQNKLDKVIEIMDDESLEAEHIANTDIDLEAEAAENEDFMRATLKAKEELGELLTEDEIRAWEHGAMSEAMRLKLGKKK